MTHFDRNPHKKVTATVPPEWVPVNRSIQRQVNEWAGRSDLVSYIGTEAAARGTKKGQKPPAACYFPTYRTIEVNTATAFGEHTRGETVGDFTLRETWFKWPRATGALMHEAGHARFTTDRMSHAYFNGEVSHRATHWFDMMDEPREEGMMLKLWPDNREFLRACALEIVIGDLDEAKLAKRTVLSSAIHLAILTIGRVDAGILKKKDIKWVREHLMTVIPESLFVKLRALWMEFLDLDGELPTEFLRMTVIAEEFGKLVEENTPPPKPRKLPKQPPKLPEEGDPEPEPSDGDASEDGDEDEGMEFAPGDGEEDEELSEEWQEFFKKLAEKLAKDAAEQRFDVDAMINQLKFQENHAKEQREKEAARRDKDLTDRIADATFKFSNGQLGKTSSRMESERPPTDREKATANKIADALKKVKYRDRVMTKVTSPIPPGRLRTNQAMQQSAVRSRGGNIQLDLFKYKSRRHVDDPNLSLGMMCDISGSMRPYMEMMSVASYVMADAVRRIQGTAATVYFGADIFATLKPKQRQDTVQVYGAHDPTENFDKAFRALDGALDILDGHGARIIVICSDGQYGGAGQLEACIKWLTACRDKGVAVIWLDGKNSNVVAGICEKVGAHQVVIGSSVTAAAEAIGAACIAALSRASA